MIEIEHAYPRGEARRVLSAFVACLTRGGSVPVIQPDLGTDVVVSYERDGRNLPPDRLALLRMTADDYTAMVNERIAKERRAPKIGDLAPDFTIERLSPSGQRTGETFTLSRLQGTPVGLIFGSYT